MVAVLSENGDDVCGLSRAVDGCNALKQDACVRARDNENGKWVVNEEK
jgi:hypothetical protein